ncbi:unnamed protein product [Pylaiella littoralis]
MAGGNARSGVVKPLTVEQIFELLDATAADLPLTSPATLLCRVEDLLLRGTGAISAHAFLVDRLFNKLLHFSPVTSGDDDGDEETAGLGRVTPTDDHGDSQGQQQQQRDATFDTHAVCDIGDGVAGMAALTGRKLRVRDCRKQQRRLSRNPMYSPDHNNGSLVCWPVRERSALPAAAASWGSTAATPAKEVSPFEQLEDVDIDNTDCDDGAAEALDSGSSEAVLAVLQLHCADGELSAEAVEVLHGVGRLLAPMLTEALARNEEYLRRRSTEAVLSLSRIVPREITLVTMIEKVVDVAQRMMEAERVCFFFVDDAADELWVAKSVDFDGANIKIGEGLCGHAAETGEIVNVIDSYKDSRFDRRWDKQTGFVTKSVLCVPVPPPDQAVLDTSRAVVSRSGGRRAGRQGSGAQDGGGGSSSSSSDSCRGGPREGRGAGASSSCKSDTFESWMSMAVDEPQSPKRAGSKLAWGGGGGGGAAAGRAEAPPTSSPRRASKMPTRPLAVVEVINKRGKGVFNEHDEDALVRLCACVESFLRRKAAEVSLLWSGMAERSMTRKCNSRGGAWSNSAWVESTMMRLYSGATIPTDPVLIARSKPGGAAAPDGGNGDDDDGGGGGGGDHKSDRRRAASDGTHDVGLAQVGKDGDRRRAGGNSSSAVSAVKGPPAAIRGGINAMSSEVSAQEESELLDLSQSLFDMSSDQLSSLVCRFFRNLGLTDVFQISDQKMRSFVQGIGQRYRPNPFHNLTHAVSVTHASFVIVKTTHINSLLRPLDKLALLVAAFCHDIDHPGNNNDYEVNSLSPLALQHGDSSVLERHHVFVAFQVILEAGGANNIFSGLTRAQFRDARQTIIQAILGTDMSQHMQQCADLFQFVRKAKKLRTGGGGRGGIGGGGGVAAAAAATRRSIRLVKGQGEQALSPAAMERRGSRSPTRAGDEAGSAQPGSVGDPDSGMGAGTPANKRPKPADESTSRGGGGGGAGACGEAVVFMPPPLIPPPQHVFSVDRAEDRSFLTRTIVHCADLSGQVLGNGLALEWGRRILEEFRLQGELEASLGLPPTMVASDDMETTMKGQHFFAAKIVKPLWEPFVALFPELDPLLENLNNNCDSYLRERLRLEQQRLLAGTASCSSNSLPPEREGSRVEGER